MDDQFDSVETEWQDRLVAILVFKLGLDTFENAVKLFLVAVNTL